MLAHLDTWETFEDSKEMVLPEITRLLSLGLHHLYKG
jgi:hypothetical protein